MKIENIGFNPSSINNTCSNSKKPIFNVEFTIDNTEKNTVINQSSEQVGYIHYANPDVELRMYKVENDDKLLYRVETITDGVPSKSQIYDPEKINLRSTTTEELLVMNNYLRDTNTYNEQFSIIDSPVMWEYHSEKFDALNAENEFIQMQYDSNNMSSYLWQKKLWDLLQAINNDHF